MSKNTNWIVMKITTKPSQYGGLLDLITFANSDEEIAHTYIDEKNRNYALWQDVVIGHDKGRGIVINNLEYKYKNKILQYKSHSKNEPLINADSIPNIVHVTDVQQDLINLSLIHI